MIGPGMLMAAAASCVALQGDPELVAEVRRDLGASGAPGRACVPVTALLARAQGGVRVELDDLRGHLARREVASAAVAAALVATWAHVEVAPLPETAAIPAVLAAPAPPRPRLPVPGPPTLAVSVRGEVSPSIDGGSYLGAVAGAWLPGAWRWLSPGLLLRVQHDPDLDGGAGRPRASRTGFEGLLGVELAGEGWLPRPYLAAGLGRVDVRRREGGGFSRWSAGLRAEAGLRAGLSVGPVELELAASAGFTPWARSFFAIDPSLAALPLAERRRHALPGEPAVTLHGGVGARWRR